MNFRLVFLQILLQGFIDLFELVRRFDLLAGQFVIKVNRFLGDAWRDFELRQGRKG